MIRPTTTLLLRKLITLPPLSPTHTSSRILRRLVPTSSHVIEYQPVLILQCSPDLIADPAMRKSEGHEPRMLLESLDEGTVIWKGIEGEDDGKWYDVGMVIGEIVEDDEEESERDVEEWTWQAYLDEPDE